MISVSNYSVRFFFSFKSVGMPLFMVYTTSLVVCVFKFDLLCFSFCFSWP